MGRAPPGPGACPDSGGKGRIAPTERLGAILHGFGARGAGNAGAGVAESVDAAASKAAVREGLGVRVPPPVPSRLPRGGGERAARRTGQERPAAAPLGWKRAIGLPALARDRGNTVRTEDRRAEGCALPVRPAQRRGRQAPCARGPDFPSDPGQSVRVTLSMSRARPSQAAARRTSSSSSGAGEARSSARLAVKYSGRKPALSSAFM